MMSSIQGMPHTMARAMLQQMPLLGHAIASGAVPMRHAAMASPYHAFRDMC